MLCLCCFHPQRLWNQHIKENVSGMLLASSRENVFRSPFGNNSIASSDLSRVALMEGFAPSVVMVPKQPAKKGAVRAKEGNREEASSSSMGWVVPRPKWGARQRSRSRSPILRPGLPGLRKMLPLVWPHVLLRCLTFLTHRFSRKPCRSW